MLPSDSCLGSINYLAVDGGSLVEIDELRRQEGGEWKEDDRLGGRPTLNVLNILSILLLSISPTLSGACVDEQDTCALDL